MLYGVNTKKCLIREAQSLKLEPEARYTISVNPEDVFSWEAIITPSMESPYRGAIILLSIKIGINYPKTFSFSHVRCLTEIYHPNINSKGYIKAEVLENSDWDQDLKIAGLVEALVLIFERPDPRQQYNNSPEIMSVFRNDYPKFEKTAQEIIKKQKLNYRLDVDDSDSD